MKSLLPDHSGDLLLINVSCSRDTVNEPIFDVHTSCIIAQSSQSLSSTRKKENNPFLTQAFLEPIKNDSFRQSVR